MSSLLVTDRSLCLWRSSSSPEICTSSLFHFYPFSLSTYIKPYVLVHISLVQISTWFTCLSPDLSFVSCQLRRCPRYSVLGTRYSVYVVGLVLLVTSSLLIIISHVLYSLSILRDSSYPSTPSTLSSELVSDSTYYLRNSPRHCLTAFGPVSALSYHPRPSLGLILFQI